MTVKQPLFVVHDVLQYSKFGPSQCLQRKKRSFFDLFKDFMKIVEGQKIVLLIVAGGIDKHPEWVEYIKQHPEWKVECHGWEHEEYPGKTEGKIYQELICAKKKIEETFGQKCTEFFPPRRKRNEKVFSACEKAGLTIHKNYCAPGSYIRDPYKRAQIDFHFWYMPDHKHANTVLDFFLIAEPIFIIGAPRSGTTALMRHLGNTIKNSVTLKEIDRIWHKDWGNKRKIDDNISIRLYYAEKLKNSNAKVLIDKNVRNSLRIPQILRIFPHARFIHLIRDGRAEAASWRKWAIKTNKPDQTIEGAAKQWVKYLDEIERFKTKIKKYEEIRYEELCKSCGYFSSRNFKWKKDLTEEEIKVVEEIQKPWLKKLGYI